MRKFYINFFICFRDFFGLKRFLCRFGEPGVSAWSGCLCCEVRGGTMGAMNLG